MLKEIDVQKMQKKVFAVMRGMAEMADNEGEINVEPKDLVQLFEGSANVYIGEGEGVGEHGAASAMQQAITDLETGCDIKQVKGVLTVIYSNDNGDLEDYNEAIEELNKTVGRGDDLNFVCCLKIDKTRTDGFNIYLAAMW